jgi:hypothetical protein
MISVFRVVGALVAAMVAAFVPVVAVEAFSAVVHPLPPDFGDTMEEMCAHVERYPAWVLAVVVPLWAGTAFVSTWIAGRLGNIFCAIIIGLLLLSMLVLNISMLPYPVWFKIATLVAMPAAIASAVYLLRPRASAAANAAV